MTQPPEQIIQYARTLGIRLWAEQTEAGPKLLFRPKGVMPLDLFRRLVEHKPAVLALLTREAREVQWRFEAMRPQVPLKGPIPFLIARQASQALGEPPWCLSCGDALAAGRQVRCVPCVLAIEQVLNEVREGA